MSSVINEGFGTVKGGPNGGDDVRAILTQPGQKSTLAIIASFEKVDKTTAYDGPTFWAKLYVFNSAVRTQNILSSSNPYKLGIVVFEVALQSVGPHTIFYPIEELQGAVESSPDGHMTILLSVGTDKNAATFIPILNVSGTIKT